MSRNTRHLPLVFPARTVTIPVTIRVRLFSPDRVSNRENPFVERDTVAKIKETETVTRLFFVKYPKSRCGELRGSWRVGGGEGDTEDGSLAAAKIRRAKVGPLISHASVEGATVTRSHWP